MAESDPIALFLEWFAAARAEEPHDASAMSLATCGPDGHPAVRMVLLKKADDRGFVFYTNLESPKSSHLRLHPAAALCFHWPALQRQVRIEGLVEPVGDEEADAYFATRARLSQLGAWASKQSQRLPGRFALEQGVAVASMRFAIGAVPRPPHWSGWRVVPQRIEFWRQELFRLHDRQLFTRENGAWATQRLFP